MSAVEDCDFEGCSLQIKTFVDKNNTVLAKAFEAYKINDDGVISPSWSISYIDGKDTAAVEVIDNLKTVFAANITKTSENSGSINAKFSDGSGSPFAVKIDYTDFRQENYRGRTVYTGTYTLSLTPPADFTSEVSGDTAALYSALALSKLTIVSSVGNDIIYETITLDVPRYGTLTLNSEFTAADGEISALPTDIIDMNKLDENGTDEETLTALSELVGELKAKVQGADSYFAEYVISALDELNDELTYAAQPAADSVDLDALYERINVAGNDVSSLKEQYDDLSDETVKKISDLDDRSYDAWNEFSYFMTLSEYEKLEATVSDIENELAALKSELEAAAQSQQTVDYDSMSYDELLEAIVDLEDRLYGAMMYDYDSIDEDLLNECYDRYEDVYDAYVNLLDEMDNGNASVPLLRKLRKAAQALDESVTKLENSVSGYAA
jgi:plasmid maintenance system antidote protein VapI